MTTQAGLIEQKRKLTAWAKYFSSNSQVINLGEKEKMVAQEDRIAAQDHSEFLTIKLTNIDNL